MMGTQREKTPICTSGWTVTRACNSRTTVECTTMDPRQKAVMDTAPEVTVLAEARVPDITTRALIWKEIKKNKKVNQYLSTGGMGQNMHSTYRDQREQGPATRDQREHRPDGNYHEGSSHGNYGHERMPCASNSKRPDYKDSKEHRAEQVQKSAVRVCGDWSEHISSSGKRYYYHCKTEVSQWEKPKEWNDSARPPDKSRDSRGNAKPSTSSATVTRDERQRHSSSNEQRCDGRNRIYMDSYSGTPDKHTQRPTDRPKSHSVDVPNSSNCPSGSNMLRGNGVSRSNSVAESHHHHYNHSGQAHASHTGYTSHPDLKRNSVYPYSSAGEPARRRSRHESDSSRQVGHPSYRPEDGSQVEAEMSPGNTSSTPSTSSTAIQTLQELQKVLTLHIKKQQSKGGPPTTSSSTAIPSIHHQAQMQHLHQAMAVSNQHLPHPHLQHLQHPSDMPPHSSPHHINSSLPPASCHSMEEGPARDQHHQQHRDQEGGQSPASVTSQRSSCRSPTPSAGSCHDTAPAIGTSALSMAALKSQQSITLSPSLSNYYNENLITHVLGWQGEQLERQADRLRQESLAFSSIHCSRVAVELKRARSNVRTAEIQSTIQEQRIMVLQQQRTEIENLKPPTSLLPS